MTSYGTYSWKSTSASLRIRIGPSRSSCCSQARTVFNYHLIVGVLKFRCRSGVKRSGYRAQCSCLLAVYTSNSMHVRVVFTAYSSNRQRGLLPPRYIRGTHWRYVLYELTSLVPCDCHNAFPNSSTLSFWPSSECRSWCSSDTRFESCRKTIEDHPSPDR